MDKQFLATAFERMCRIRQFDNYVHESMKKEGSPFVGIMHTQVGEEGYSAALIPQLRMDDYLSTTYRSHAHTLARGMPLKALASEVCGRQTGVCKGRAGNMHAVDQDLNIIGGFGIIGAGVPATVGTALASSYKGTDQISVAFFGDGSLPQGAVHESLNLAKIFNLPVLFVNNNNQYAMSTPSRHNLATDTTTNYAKGYGIPAIKSCGMDFFKAYDAAKQGIEHVRGGKGPFFIEYECYRFNGQFEGDPQLYQNHRELDYYWKKDPIKLFRQGALDQNLLTQNELDEIELSVAEQVAGAMEFALASKPPDPSDITSDIYADIY